MNIEDIEEAREATDDDLEVIRADEHEGIHDASETRVVEGPLEVVGALDIAGGALIVKGDLTVTGYLSSDETGMLIVTGALRCKNLYLEGDLEVHGDARVEQVVFGYYEAGMSYFFGDLEAELLLLGNHAHEIEADRLKARHTIRFQNFKSHRGDVAPEEILSDEALAAVGPLLGIDAPEGAKRTHELLKAGAFLRRRAP